MKSNKQRRKEIKQKRQDKRYAKAQALRLERVRSTVGIDVYTMPDTLPEHAILADHDELIHNNTYGFLPLFYVDKAFVCRGCGDREVWKAKQQKWWYEVAKGHIDSRAVQCLVCRKYDQAKREEQKRHMAEVANREPNPHEAFFKKK